MSKFWSKIFRKKTTLKENIDEEERGPHMPPKELPIEQSFAQKFTACGGKFVYCEKIQDAKDAFNSIIKQYPSEIRELFCLDPILAQKLDVGITLTKTNLNAKVHGSVDIEYKGAPSQKDIRIFGSGDVDQYADDI